MVGHTQAATANHRSERYIAECFVFELLCIAGIPSSQSQKPIVFRAIAPVLEPRQGMAMALGQERNGIGPE